MEFLILLLFLWGTYAFFMKRQYKNRFLFSRTLIPLILVCILSTVCLGINYVASAIPSLNDGIAIHNFMSSWILPDENWSTQIFKDYFNLSVYISLSLTCIYCVLKLIKK